MFRYDTGKIYAEPRRGQIHVDGNEVRKPHCESIPAVRKLGRCISGARNYVFEESDVTECIERLDEAGHRITVSWNTIEKYGDDWEITDEGSHYPKNWDTIRKKVYKQHDHTCNRCGKTDVTLHAHHQRAISDGGSHEPHNLEAVCEDCHEDIHGFTIN